MKVIQILLFLIFLTLVSINLSIEKWGAEIVSIEFKKVENIYKYNVNSYGTIKLNDKLTLKAEKG